MKGERQQWADAASLLGRSAFYHLMDIKPAAAPDLYAGKVESTLLIAILDNLGVSPHDIELRRSFF